MDGPSLRLCPVNSDFYSHFKNPKEIMEPHVTNGLHITTDTTGEQNAMNNINQQNGHENGNL